ncbi:ABC transporter substrate-binding protein [Oxynema aestuarii]|uniref:Spermidine/putrescine ABC transporter substrate-binding protein n=1 Tax=Oxynema aestuarii AP17 TaxID=2064643 RepID=A0A6H1TUA3_9CYAN|nr:spermidine/putrescine ABC transporter substrate-binding protein [Oxynema aestuarii]QIZ70005.1 spermidine/putrescine ABC transporter substrate-binding protein [Oxynema aestuarii AP17]RMH77465.1 MAG: extracellular solute-binding protein [Cyanobacteria bacterium J007]
MPPTVLNSHRPSQLTRGGGTRRQFLKASSAALSGLALSSCGWTLANVQPTAPTDPNKLYIYTWAGYTDDELLERFRERTGISVVADVFSDNDSMLARIQAGGGGSYSIIYPSDYMVNKMAGLNLLTELDRDRLVGLDRLFPRFQDPLYDPGNRYSVPISWGTTGLVYNAKKLNPPPEDWDYLWEHRNKLSRRITLINDVREVMGASLRSLGYSYNSTDADEIRAAYEHLADLKPAIASFTTDAWRPQILTGDLLAAMCFSADASLVMEENPDLDYVLPKSGSSIWGDTLVIPQFAPNPDAAYQWINFMLEPDVAASMTERLSFATPNRAAFQQLPEEIRNNPTLFPPEEALEKSESIQPVGKAAEIYDLYWTRLTSS